MKNEKKFALGIFVLVLVLLVNFVSAADVSRTWNCNNGLGDCINYPLHSGLNTIISYCGQARPVWSNAGSISFQFSEYFFDAPQNGEYNCVITIVETGYGYYDGLQINENSDVWVNGVKLGRTTDGGCNSGTSCTSCADSSTSFTKTLTLGTTGNNIKLESFQSHALRSVSISCDYIPSCVPATEVCDGIDNDCDGLIDEGIADIVSGTDAGECRTEIRRCVSGSFRIVQTGIGPTTEICNNLDDDCDGRADEGLNCNSECVQDSDCFGFNSNSSNYCYNNDVYKNMILFGCTFGGFCRPNPLERFLVQDCGEDSQNYSSNYCLGDDIVRNVTNIDRGCSSGACFANNNKVVVVVEECDDDCLNGQCVNRSSSNLSVNITYPANGMVFVSNSSPYLITINASANQRVNNWSLNGTGYFNSGFNFSRAANITFGINNFVVCGTNENGTDCDSVSVELRNVSSPTNGTLFIDIISPVARTYDTGNILLNISSNGTYVWYNYNGTNVTYNGSYILNLDEGSYNLVAWANNSAGNVVNDSVRFRVDFGGDDEDCENCDDCEEEDFGFIFADEGTGYVYNGTGALVLTSNESEGEFVWADLLFSFLLLVLILGILVLVLVIARTVSRKK